MPGKFPQYEFRPYPKMPHDENGKPYLKADKSCVVVNDAHEESLFHADPKRFGAVIKSVSVPASGATSATIAALANESEEIAKLRAEIASLKAAPVIEKKKPGRPAKVKADLPSDLD
jgi:hypothetical protein